ncbi:hypothetical protein K7432_001470 [Basidiobolus ranarum]|uniref:Uncharacterized protein n=1 Tax=Basidiobolus ranarum TaxID=34480 RepID=A0ABR2X312_9FUNG
MSSVLLKCILAYCLLSRQFFSIPFNYIYSFTISPFKKKSKSNEPKHNIFRMKLTINYSLCIYVILLDSIKSAVICRQPIAPTKVESKTLDTFTNILEIVEPRIDRTNSDLKFATKGYAPKTKHKIGSKCTCPKNCTKHGNRKTYYPPKNLLPSNGDNEGSESSSTKIPNDTPSSSTNTCRGKVHESKIINHTTNTDVKPLIQGPQKASPLESPTNNIGGAKTDTSNDQIPVLESQNHASLGQPSIPNESTGIRSDQDPQATEHQSSISEPKQEIVEEPAVKNEPEAKTDEPIFDRESSNKGDILQGDKPDPDSSNDINHKPEEISTIPNTVDVPIIDGIFAFLPRKSPTPLLETVLVQSPPIVL